MGYYLRAFCTSEDLPPLGRVVEWAAAQGVPLALEHEPDPGALGPAGWRWAEIRYKHSKRPLVVDVSRAAGNGLPLEEPRSSSSSSPRSRSQRRRAGCLPSCGKAAPWSARSCSATSTTTATTPSGSSWTAFVERCGGMIHADGEGFYDGDRLIVELV
jgi:hypothetical protein